MNGIFWLGFLAVFSGWDFLVFISGIFWISDDNNGISGLVLVTSYL